MWASVSFSRETTGRDGPVVGARMPLTGKPRRTRRLVLRLFLLIVLGAIVWVLVSESPVALGVQELVGWKHDQTVVDAPFSVGPHGFRYYKFTLPEGSVNVDIVGHFRATGQSQKAGNENNDADKDSKKLEVYVLTDPAFIAWQTGSATSSLISFVYDSGRVPEGRVNQELPAGAGTYYLVFSNRFSPNADRSVQATIFLRYKSWLLRALSRRSSH